MKTNRYIVLITLLCLVMPHTSGQAYAKQPPNILFVIVDDLGRQDLGCYGSTFYETPNIDTLAKQGMRFENAYCAHPRCVPSRVAMMSGRYAARYGVPGASKTREALPLEAVTFAEHLQQADYSTCYIGKWHIGGKKGKGGPWDQGFDETYVTGEYGAPPSYYFPYDKARQAGHKGFPKTNGEEGDYLTDHLTDLAIKFIEKKREQPFLLVLAHYAVHTPIEAKEEITDKYKKRIRKEDIPKGGPKSDKDVVQDKSGHCKSVQNNAEYAAMIESVDEGLGRIKKALEIVGAAENTIIVLTSDHGGLSSRGLHNKRELATTNLPYRHGKGWLYDGGLRVPLIAHWPGKISPGTVTQSQVTGTDHYPTILQMAGVPLAPKDHLDGESYLPTLEGKTRQRSPMHWHSPLGRPYSTGDTNSTAIIDNQWKLIDWYEEGTVELYNLEEDLGEQSDLSKTKPEKTSSMLAKLNQWRVEVKAPILDPSNDKKRQKK